MQTFMKRNFFIPFPLRGENYVGFNSNLEALGNYLLTVFIHLKLFQISQFEYLDIN